MCSMLLRVEWLHGVSKAGVVPLVFPAAMQLHIAQGLATLMTIDLHTSYGMCLFRGIHFHARPICRHFKNAFKTVKQLP